MRPALLDPPRTDKGEEVINELPDAPSLTVARVEGLSKSYGRSTVLDGIDLTIAAGEIVALLGASGSGKTTLLRILAGLDEEADGTVAVEGQPAVVFQEHRLIPWKRVADNISLGLHRPDAKARALEMLEEVGLSDRAGAWPRELSGGQAQRVALARGLVREPELLLLDEPFGALDALTRMRMHALVKRLFERHRPGVLFVTHDVDEALVLADRLLVIVDGRIGFDAPVDLPHPRRRSGPAFDELRAALLEALDVHEDV
jgi:sulfonate transport system ATP-binding protein